ncbi:hypothetical protein GCM10023213_05650 [Prosthecobacter algae]|uniref:Uncharacterized protein n=1 Tax=Prosthecobacter algae TaxID=1144682 RepID=A0ABP9NUP3_9BACT
MVAHDGQRIASLHHASHGVQHLADSRTAVNVVAQEDHLSPFRVAVGVAVWPVAQVLEETGQFPMLAVNVSDEVVGLRFHCTLSMAQDVT